MWMYGVEARRAKIACALALRKFLPSMQCTSRKSGETFLSVVQKKEKITTWTYVKIIQEQKLTIPRKVFRDEVQTLDNIRLCIF